VAILETEVWVGVGGRVAKHFESLGYEIPRYKDKNGKLNIKRGTKILVDVKDLKNSSISLTKVCDICGNHTANLKHDSIIRHRKSGDGLDRCYSCASKVGAKTRQNNIKHTSSLEYWAKEYNKTHLLNEFNISNKKKPNQISFGSTVEYVWNCPKCESQYYMKVCERTNSGNGCPYCRGLRVNNTNCLATTHPEISRMLLNKQRGLELTSGSHKKVDFTCPNCGNIVRNKMVKDVIRQGLPCSKCSDGVSYPEKFLICLLQQLNIAFEKEISFEWSKRIVHPNKKLCGNKKYDFYLPSLNIIIETHGRQHYVESFGKFGGRDIKEEQDNDSLKEALAKNNYIKDYIVINSSESDYLFMKEKILNSKLNYIFDLNTVDWLKCHEYACGTLVKEASDLWNSGVKNAREIGVILNLNRSTIIRFLKRATEIGWIKYNPKTEMVTSNRYNAEKNAKKVIQLSKSGDFIKGYFSMAEAAESVGIHHTSISKVCNKNEVRYKTAGGYKWMFKEDYDNYLKELVNN
jgi:predicted RNA-binding Zn-ribbon protein involved in translation (DUF1610 family)